jgi:hypothetical protein
MIGKTDTGRYKAAWGCKMNAETEAETETEIETGI